MSDLLQLAEVVLSHFGPIMLRAGCWCCVNDNCICPTNRPLTARELATPAGDRPNAHLWALWVTVGGALITPCSDSGARKKCDWSAEAGNLWHEGATATEAILAALAAAAGEDRA